jgi:asparagine synthase (glutamine-hydrolysing)
MRGLCGWFSDGPAAEVGTTLQRMLASYQGSTPNADFRALSQAGLAVFGEVARPTLIQHDTITLAVMGHPRWRDGNGAAIDPIQIAVRLRERGRDALAALGGDFALASWDETQRRGLLAVDRMGAQPLVYGHAAGTLMFGSTLDLVFGHGGLERRLSMQAVFDYLYYHVTPGPETIFEGVRRVPPGHCVEFGPRGAAEPVPYWTLRFEEDSRASLGDLKHEFLELVRDSVRDAADGDASGSFLSGGTDSSTVSGMLGRVTGRPARTFSMGFDVPGYDETEYARIAARHFGTEHHEYYVTPHDVVEAVPMVAAAYDQPFGNASAVPAFCCARYAREHGIRRLLAGDGGDELFGGNERYAKQHLLALYHRMPGTVRKGMVEPVLLNLPGVGAVPPLRKLRSYVEQARADMPLRYESYNLMQHFGVAEMFTPDFLSAVDAQHPLALLSQAHAPFAEDSLINQMLAIDLRFVLTDGDLPKVLHTCNLAEVDVSFPLLDDRIIDFSLRLPSSLKLRGTQLRWFFKEALRDFLPAEIITKKKHGFGLPVGRWLIDHQPLFDLAMDSIERLRPRGILRPQFVKELVDVKLREHPGYYGTMVWVLMMLSLWLDSRRL